MVRLLVLVLLSVSANWAFLLPGTPELDNAQAVFGLANPDSKVISSRLVGEPVATIPYLGAQIKIYKAPESAEHPQTLYYYNPVAVVDQSSVQYWYSNALNQHFVGFKVHTYNETLLHTVANHLSQDGQQIIQPFHIQTVPYDHVILKSIPDSNERYSTAHSWTPFKDAFGLTLNCFKQVECLELAQQIRTDLRFVLDHFQLAFSDQEHRRTETKKVDITPAMIMERNQLLVKINSRYNKINEVLLTVGDAERLLWNAASNIIRRHFESQSQTVVTRDSHKIVYDRLEKLLIAGRTSISTVEDSKWNLVYWNDPISRPDAVARSLNDRRVYLNEVHHHEDEDIPSSGEWKSDAVRAAMDQIYSKHRDFVAYDGVKFDTKPIQLYRLKLSVLKTNRPSQSLDQVVVSYHPGVDYLGYFIALNNPQLNTPELPPASSLARRPEDGVKLNIMGRLIAGQTLIVRLKNARTGEYLYPGRDELSHDSKRRRVFTWRNTKEVLGPWAEWRLSGLWRAGTFRIRMTSVRFPGEYLYPSSDEFTYDKERRRVFTWRQSSKPEDVHLWADGAADWLLDTYRVNTEVYPNRYTLFNLKRREYLYAASDSLAMDETRRRVFTWRGTDNEVWTELKNQWDVEIVRSTY